MKTPKNAFGLNAMITHPAPKPCKGFAPSRTLVARSLRCVHELTPEQMTWAESQIKKS